MREAIQGWAHGWTIGAILISFVGWTPSAQATETSIGAFEAPAVSEYGDSEFVPGLREFADFLWDRGKSFDDLLKDPALTAVTHEFGPSVISARQFPFQSGMAVAAPKPWSSWWYPKIDRDLFENPTGHQPSVLEKYDLIRKKRAEIAGERNPPASAADFERKNYNPRVASWEGLCDAWALAAVSQPEPVHPVTVKAKSTSVTFSVGELKALALMTYEGIDDTQLKFYGQKFTGDARGWVFPDIFPEQFHRFVEVQLFRNKTPFVMDHDPGIEVWNVPVYKANYVMDKVPGDPNAVFVRAWLYSAESVQTNEKDFVGTREAVREYDYVLQGTRDGSGNLVIQSGYWVKGPGGVDSRSDHPDYITVFADPAKPVRKSSNPGIDVSVVDEILSASH